jgi:phosphoribosyl 1,2-cyclic phosphate phosphodiesterase
VTIKFLGTGTSQGIPVVGCKCSACTSTNIKDKRLRSSLFIELNDTKIIIDTGPDLRQQLLTHHISNLDAILYTHEHNDHTAGLDDVRPINFLNEKIIPAYGLHRVLADIEVRFKYAFTETPYPGAPRIDLIPIKPFDLINIHDIEVLTLDIIHGSIHILGYRIFNMAYLTDVSAITEETYAQLQDLDILIISALQHKAHHSHISMEEAISIAQKINAKSTYFIHMSHTLGPLVEWEPQLPTSIFAAYDGLSLEC